MSIRWPPRLYVSGVTHQPPAGYHRAALVMYLGGGKDGPGAPLDVPYAFSQLKRWAAEGPTARNKKMVRFILSRGHLGPGYSDKRRGLVPENTLLLIDCAVEWNDFAMWTAILKRSGGYTKPQVMGSTPLIRAWSAFPFNVTRPMLVPPQPKLPRYTSHTHIFHFKRSSQI